VEFVLSRELGSLSPEQREALIHSTRDRRLLSASVEIIFDNEDGRLPIKKASIANS
jgi:structural maintenance of chromosome 3 (chondroitin sulfate proteoglycan 6)